MALNSFAVFDALKDLSVTEYTCYGDITDDDSLKENLNEFLIYHLLANSFYRKDK